MQVARLLVFVAALMAQAGAWSGETLRLAPGASMTIQVPENVTTGYSWAIDDPASSNLDILSIADLGHKRGAKRVGAAGTHAWAITARSPGRATLALVYRRPWDESVAARRSYIVAIAP